MIEKVDVLMPTTSQYHVLHHFARKLYEAFVRTGLTCRLLEGDDRILVPLRSPPDFSIGFNGALKMEDDSLFCDHIKVPHVACLVDPPFRFLSITKSPHVIITCDDQLCCEMLRGLGFARTAFMPHAVEQDLSTDTQLKKLYEVVFLATCIDCEKRRRQWRKDFPADIVKLMEEAAEAALADEETSFISGLQHILSPWEYQQVFEEVELYIKGRDRLDLVDAIVDTKVHVFGGSVDKAGWKSLLKHKSNVVVHRQVDYKQALEIMKQSKIVLNSSIKNKLGAHERIFTAAACGAVVVTNKNPYVVGAFQDRKEILLYKRDDFAGLNDAIQDLLQNEDRRVNIAAAGRKKVMQQHTWDCRVRDLMKAITPMIEEMRS